MPMPDAPRIVLPQQARRELQTLGQAHSTPQALALRARIVLRAGDVDTPSNMHIAHGLGCSHRPVGKWRQRYHDQAFLGRQDALRSGRPRTMLSSMRVRVISVASELPQAQDRTVTRWTLDERVGTVLDDLRNKALSRSSIWRILQEVALKPHKSAYGLNSHDEHFASKADAICQLYVKARALYHQSHWVIGCDEKNRPASVGAHISDEDSQATWPTRAPWTSGYQAFAMSRGSRRATVSASSLRSRLCRPALVPSPFRVSVSR